MGDKIIYWGTLLIAWALLPIAAVRVAWDIAVDYIEATFRSEEK